MARSVQASCDTVEVQVAEESAGARMHALEAEVAQLREALDSRTVIGQATGIYMERFRVPNDAAFAMLVRMSQAENRKLRDIAAGIVHAPPGTGQGDGAGAPPDPAA